MADHEKFPVEVLTPDGVVFAEEVQMISTKTTIGSIGVLAHHAPLLAMLDPTELRLYRSDSDVVSFAQSEGYLQVADNRHPGFLLDPRDQAFTAAGHDKVDGAIEPRQRRTSGRRAGGDHQQGDDG